MFIDKSVGKLRELILGHDVVDKLNYFLFFYIFGVDPFCHSIASSESSYFDLQSSRNEYIFRLNEVGNVKFVQILKN